MTLKWRGIAGGDYKAWAPELYPRDSMPPVYLIIKVDGGSKRSKRVVKMLRGPLGNRRVEHVASAPTLAEAKSRAERHYVGRSPK